MSLIAKIQRAMVSDDDDQSERLLNTYLEADDAGKSLIDDFMICLCGWSMKTMTKERAPRAPAPPVDPRYATMGGSWGESKIDLETGALDPPYGDSSDGDPLLVRVDLYEWELAYGRKMRPGEHFDVLDLAHIQGNGGWSEAEESWRTDWARENFKENEDARYYWVGGGREAVRQYAATVQR